MTRYKARYTTWNKVGEEDRDIRAGKGFFVADSKIDVINQILYEIRGRKSDRELAKIKWIKDVEGEASE